jgi:hypothetical protein
MIYPAFVPERGAVRLIVIDQDVLAGTDRALMTGLLERHADSVAVLLARSGTTPSAGPWRRVISRPVSIAGIVHTVLELLPLPAEQRHPID